MWIDEKPGAEEQYSSAVSSSNLKVDLTRRSEADAIIAAGWSTARVGAALMRLHTEFDKAAKPKPLTADAIKRMAASITVAQIPPVSEVLGLATGSLRPAAAVEAIAKARAHAWFLDAMQQLLGSMREFPGVRDQLAREVATWGFEPAESREVAVEVIRWWLSPKCMACNGTKWQLVPGSNRQSNHACRACRGAGDAPVPFGGTGKRLLIWMNECRGSARGNIHHALRGKE